MPVLLIERLLKVATPPEAATVVVPESVPPPGLVPIATLTLAVLEVRLPPASWICTVTAGVIVDAVCVLLGCCANASLAAAPTVMLKAELGADAVVSPSAASVAVSV